MRTRKQGKKSAAPPPPPYWNCAEFDGETFIPGLPVSSLTGNRKGVGLDEKGALQKKRRGVPLADVSPWQPKVQRRRVYCADLQGGAVTESSSRSHVLLLLPPCGSLRVISAGGSGDIGRRGGSFVTRSAAELSAAGLDVTLVSRVRWRAHAATIYGAPDYRWEALPGESIHMDSLALRLLVRLPIVAQDERQHEEAPPVAAIAFTTWTKKGEERSMVVGTDPAHTENTGPCRLWSADYGTYARLTRETARAVSKLLLPP